MISMQVKTTAQAEHITITVYYLVHNGGFNAYTGACTNV